MRSAAEWMFRARQEAANLRLFLLPLPSETLDHTDVALPDTEPVLQRLRDTDYSARMEVLAQAIMQHRFPIAGQTLETGQQIEWRRDYRNGVSSSAKYFRFVPYLDYERVGDHKNIWDLNRHQHLVVLAQAFRLTGRQEYLDEVVAQVHSWLVVNPYMRGINWTSALEVGFRALSWIWIYHLVGTRLSSSFRQTLAKGLHRHARYLEHNLSTYFSPNTHLLGEAVALHALGTLFPGFKQSSRWKAIGREVVSRQMEAQVRDDGSHIEQSSSYHVYALDLFLFHHLLDRTSLEFQAKLRRMADYLNALMGRSRTLPLIGDDDGGRVFHPYGRCDRFGRATLATCALVFDESSWQFEEQDTFEQAAWWLGKAAFRKTDDRERRQPESILFRGSGLAVMASGPVQVLIDAGPFGSGGGGHSHSDTLSIIVRDSDEDILVDAGTYTYVADRQLRDWFRGSSAHNTVQVDGRNQAIGAGPFRWVDKPAVDIRAWSSDAEHDFLDAACRSTARPEIIHRRRALFLKRPDGLKGGNLLVIQDDLQGPAGVHLIEQFWHPGEPIRHVGPGHVQIGTDTRLVAAGGAQFTESDHWRSRGFGEKTRATALAVHLETTFPATIWLVLGIGLDDDLAFLSVSESGNEAVIRVCAGRLVRVVLDSVTGVTYAFGV